MQKHLIHKNIIQERWRKPTRLPRLHLNFWRLPSLAHITRSSPGPHWVSLAHAFLLGSLSWHRHSPGTFFQQGLNAKERTSSRWVCLRIAIFMGKDGDSPWKNLGYPFPDKPRMSIDSVCLPMALSFSSFCSSSSKSGSSSNGRLKQEANSEWFRGNTRKNRDLFHYWTLCTGSFLIWRTLENSRLILAIWSFRQCCDRYEQNW